MCDARDFVKDLRSGLRLLRPHMKKHTGENAKKTSKVVFAGCMTLLGIYNRWACLKFSARWVDTHGRRVRMTFPAAQSEGVTEEVEDDAFARERVRLVTPLDSGFPQQQQQQQESASSSSPSLEDSALFAYAKESLEISRVDSRSSITLFSGEAMSAPTVNELIEHVLSKFGDQFSKHCVPKGYLPSAPPSTAAGSIYFILVCCPWFLRESNKN